VSVLSEEDRAFWDENGYVIIHDAVPAENIKAAENAIWNFLEMWPDNPDSWYPDTPRKNITMEMYHHQALWDNRQYPRIHQAFAEIWGTDRLWVSIDRASMNPPDRTSPKEAGKLNGDSHSKQPIPLPLHWDIAVERPIPFCVQGVLYLTDTAADGGAFICVPGFHRKLEAWLANLPADADPRKQDLMSLGATPIPGKAGDLIIWHSSLPHGAGLNTRRYPRVVQYITMYPVQEKDENILTHRVNAWRNNLAGLIVEATDSTWELRKEKEHAVGQTANLSPLGRKLLGLDRWESES
jgi:hypothetical protein